MSFLQHSIGHALSSSTSSFSSSSSSSFARTNHTSAPFAPTMQLHVDGSGSGSGSGSGYDDGDQSAYLTNILWIYLGPFIFAIGIVGNLLIVVVVGHPNMKDAPTCTYLKWMAVADILTLVTGMIPEWLDYMGIFVLKEYHEVACKLEKFVNFTSIDTSIWICLVFTVERFIAVCFPLSETFICPPSNAKMYVAAAFLAAIIKNFHILFTRGAEFVQVFVGDPGAILPSTAVNGTGDHHHHHHNHHHQQQHSVTTQATRGVSLPAIASLKFVSNCGSPNESFKYFEKFVRPWIAYVTVSLVPCLVIVVCNVFIVRSLLLLRLNRNKIPSDSESGNVRQMTILCLTASICFLVCNTPSMILLIGKPYWGADDNVQYKLAKPVLNQIFYVNHSINFFLYCMTGKRFRQTLGQIFRSYKHPSAAYEITGRELLNRRSSRLSYKGPKSRSRLSTVTSLCPPQSFSVRSDRMTSRASASNSGSLSEAFQTSVELTGWEKDSNIPAGATPHGVNENGTSRTNNDDR